MMFILRCDGEAPASVPVKARRKTPAIVPGGAGKTDFFCVGTTEEMAALRGAGLDIVELRDGWYADDAGGGVAIFGQGRYWEVRDTPFTVREASPPGGDPPAAAGEQVDVRGAIFGGQRHT